MTCKACGNKMAHLVEDLFICSDCTLISSTVQPDPSIYDKSYVLKYQRYEKTELNEKINAHRLSVLKEFYNGGRVLDYGCGVGSFVKYANLHGIQTHGYDINPYGAFYDPTVLLKDNKIMTLWDSIEHITDPMALIQGIDPDAICICTPSTDDWTGKKSDLMQWRHYMPEEHVHYFNERSLNALLESMGYKSEYLSYEESEMRKGGGNLNIITIGGVKNGAH